MTFDQIYPVGCVYTSTVSTSPATLFGGIVYQTLGGLNLLPCGSSAKYGTFKGLVSC